MEDIKDAVGLVLERQGVLSRLRAELRAKVFIAIDDQEQSNGGQGLSQKSRTPQRQALLATSEGQLLFGLVREFLKFCSLDFTLQVYDPEAGVSEESHNRPGLFKQLGLPDAPGDAPLLLALLRRVQTGGPPAAGSSTGAQPSSTAAGAGGPGTLGGGAGLLRRAPLAPVGRGLAPKEPDSSSAPASLPAFSAGGAAGKGPTAPLLSSSLPKPFGASTPRPAAAAPPAPSALEASGVYADDFASEVDEDLDSKEMADDDEDYAAAVFENPGSRGRGGQAQNLRDMDEDAFAGDRSGGVSTELGGYAADAAFTQSSHLSPIGSAGSGALSSSGDALRGPLPKAALAPLGPPRGLVPAKMLAPLGSLNKAPLSSAFADDAAQARSRNNSDAGAEAPQDSASAPSRLHHSSGGNSGGGGTGGGMAPLRSGGSLARPGSGVYDGEMSVSNSLDIIEAAAPVSALPRQLPGMPARRSDLGGDDDQPFSRVSSSVSRGNVSMDFRETGLSAEDNSGELDQLMFGADLAEGAWES